jgi:hypothetical protein
MKTPANGFVLRPFSFSARHVFPSGMRATRFFLLIDIALGHTAFNGARSYYCFHIDFE